MELDSDYLVKTLQELVKIPSPPRGEEKVAKLVVSKLQEMGLRAEVDGYFNVIAELGSGKRRVLLNAHLDTVPPGNGWTIDPYSGMLREGKVYGRGASDNKAGVAAMLTIAMALVTQHLPGRLVLLFTSREEGGGKVRARRGLKDKVDVDAGICLDHYIDAEDRQCEVVIGCRGIANVEVIVEGKAYHSSEPELGVNAIYRAYDLISELRSPRILQRMERPLPVVENVTVTVIKGGEWPTMVPDSCYMNVNFRLLPTLSPKDAVRRVLEVANRALKHGFKVRLKGGLKGYVIEPSSPIAKAALEAAKDEGFKAWPTVAKGWIDAAQLHRLFNVPIVSIGTMTRGQAHVKDEYVKVADVLNGARIAAKTILNFFKLSGGS